MELLTQDRHADLGPPPQPPPPGPPVDLPPDSLGYRLKRKLLGLPLHTEQLAHERLGKPTALAVFASDNLSSSAYATEEILRVLVPAVGLAAFSLVVPITVAMLGVLALLILSYRETIKAYPTAGGAYMVTRDNFGLLPAQVAGVALLTDYVLTVSVSVAAGTAALASAFSALVPCTVPISVAFIALIAYGNLRGVRESGRLFAAPTYFFIANMVVLLVGLWRMATGGLPEAEAAEGMLAFGRAGDGILLGASLFIVLHALASGGAAVTGVEAISNGVPAFRPPEWRNARTTLVIMGSTLGAMFFGLSVLAGHMHVAPFEEGTPTVISQIGGLVYGDSPLGHALYYALQAGTMLILVLAANTSFADFPRLASFHAGDNAPRPPVRDRNPPARARRPGRRHGAHPPSSRRPRLRRPARPRRRPGHPVRENARARRAAGSALRGRPPASRGANRGVAALWPGPGAPRARGMPRPAAHAGRRRDRGPGAGRRGDRGERAAARPHVRDAVAPDPPRPDGRGDRPGRLPAAPRQRDDGAVPPRVPAPLP